GFSRIFTDQDEPVTTSEGGADLAVDCRSPSRATGTVDMLCRLTVLYRRDGTAAEREGRRLLAITRRYGYRGRHRQGGCEHVADGGPHGPARNRIGIRGAGPRQGARGAGTFDYQSRYRPARFLDARAHRRGWTQGACRRASRLHAGKRHSTAARSGRGRSP